MNRDEIKSQLERLITEAPQVAPSIARYDETKSYGEVTDEELDEQALQRWELEIVAMFNQLADSGATVFQQIHSRYLNVMQDSRQQHSKSILVHQLMLLLNTAAQLLDSPVSSMHSSPDTKIASPKLEMPPTVTISWLLNYVPVPLWFAVVGVLLAVFIAGIQASEISLVREIFKLSRVAPASITASQVYAPTKP